MEDTKIIDLFFQRSEQALRELDLSYGKSFKKLSYNIVNSREDAEECVSDAYLGVWNTIPPLKPDPLFPYVCKIVRNISLNVYHRKKAAKRNSTYDVAMQELEGCLPAQATVETELETKELIRLIERFLDTLTAENRIIFMRRYWFSDTYADIAQQVGLTEKNVSVRLTRIRRKLKEYLIKREASL